MKSMIKNQHGFTQFELILVLIVICIFVAMSAAVYFNFTDEAKSVAGRANEKSAQAAKTMKHSLALLHDPNAKLSAIKLEADDFRLVTVPPWLHIEIDSTWEHTSRTATVDNQFVQNFKTGAPANSKTGPIRILAVDSNQVDLLNNQHIQSQLSADQFVTTSRDGMITIGNENVGISTLKINKGDLPQDTNISVKWDTAELFNTKLFVFELEPHGTVFNHPVKLNLSYQMAQLDNVSENNLNVYYFDEEENLWEFIGGKVDISNKQIETEINHFSRYSIAFSR